MLYMSIMRDEFLKDYKLEGKRLKIHTFPDKCLAAKSVLVEEINDQIVELCRDMLYTMYHAPGIGFAAPQVGKNLRLFVMDTDYTREKFINNAGEEEYRLENFNPKVFINPILTRSGDKVSHEEGCLSLPGFYEEVMRPSQVVVEYLDLNGVKQSLEATGVEAVCIQHEFDHLEGVVFIDHLSLLKRNIIKKKLIKAKQKND